MEKKDILKYFIDYCKDDNGDFSLNLFNDLLDKGAVLTNENGEFEIPEKNIYVISNTENFNSIFNAYDIENFSERETDNGFENTGLTQLQTLLGADYSIITEKGLIELVSGNSKFLEYPELFTISEFVGEETFNVLRILEKGVVINYDGRFNNIIISGVETWLKYAEAVAVALPSNLKYSVTGDVEVEAPAAPAV